MPRNQLYPKVGDRFNAYTTQHGNKHRNSPFEAKKISNRCIWAEDKNGSKFEFEFEDFDFVVLKGQGNGKV